MSEQRFEDEIEEQGDPVDDRDDDTPDDGEPRAKTSSGDADEI